MFVFVFVWPWSVYPAGSCFRDLVCVPVLLTLLFVSIIIGIIFPTPLVIVCFIVSIRLFIPSYRIFSFSLRVFAILFVYACVLFFLLLLRPYLSIRLFIVLSCYRKVQYLSSSLFTCRSSFPYLSVRLFFAFDRIYRSVSLSCCTGSFPLSLRVVSILFLFVFFSVLLRPTLIVVLLFGSWNWYLMDSNVPLSQAGRFIIVSVTFSSTGTVIYE